jgi:hypothetical protein
MNVQLELLKFDKFTKVLNDAGIITGSGQGFWGGVTADGEIVVTSWIDGNDGAGRFYIGRPKTNHGGLKDQWDVGNIRVGSEVRMILLRQRGRVPFCNTLRRRVSDAVLTLSKWRVVELVSNNPCWQAVIEPV